MTNTNQTKVSVIGAGVMGGGIACLFANAGFEVLLLDVAIDQETLWQRFENAKQPLLAHKSKKQLLTLGIIDENLKKLKDCDLVIEAVVESEEIKKSLYNKIAKYLKPGAILASNTSTMQLSKLKSLANIDNPFIILHFFNPPKIMDLVEVVIEPRNSELENRISKLLANDLGKVPLFASDTPGFVANRIGCFFIEMVTRRALAQDIAPELVDHYLDKLFGLPKTGAFGLYDLIGHDVMHFISSSLMSNLSRNDLYHSIYLPNKMMEKMLTDKVLGNKTKGGFYKNIDSTRYVINQDLSYRSVLDVQNKYDNAEKFLKSKTPVSQFFHDVLQTLQQYISTIEKITIDQIDMAMKWGFNWRIPPSDLIEMIRQNNTRPIAQLAHTTRIHKKSPDQTVDHKIVLQDKEALCLESENRITINLRSPKGVLTQNSFQTINRVLDYANKSSNIEAIVLCNTNEGFSAGADLKYIHYLIDNNDFNKLNQFLKLGQDTMLRMKYHAKPIISCAFGFALGGGMELLLNSSKVIANCDLLGGLVESSIGFLPSFGGAKEMLYRARDAKQLTTYLHNILIGKKSRSCYYLQEDYGVDAQITMMKHSIIHSDLLNQISAQAIAANRGDVMPKKFNKVDISNDDIRQNQNPTTSQELLLAAISQIIKEDRTEQELLDWERDTFLELSKLKAK
ncbi:3-hydroxyacyl-CoA dehydrogenase/enoyl-CoA hydratase family protein [Rickettsiales endosymbiont of Paramecium tredecaurelia]|uniref:3-hydroxyacyl-CoA dehydrogenase/enoyl-CoA hydratase family protein n=1 Tax=Candidatus Sarmatiella mevalonica TaxID=2770581 RepID=UPI0019236CD0|nr:3-hydroxyacyl-CoA dehydrogenase/enoyl-CoA hydratase family protein [Candidatus Sarmatiella mevalonica]MBL3284535.1 3-hydroxyacyl-CoA dehydrogenase/enoyl-CoA hydratase family protein [Candidatus Sarmatiella mevalonica]